MKWLKRVALPVQFFLILLAIAGTGFVFGFSVAYDAGPLFITAYAVVLLSYAAAVFYASYGYKRGEAYYLGAVYAFCGAILLNLLLPFRTTYQLVTLAVLLALYAAFAQRLANRRAANWLLLCMLLFAAAFSVYSTATARTENLNDLAGHFFSVAAMYISIWTPVIMTVTLGLAYILRKE